MIKNEDWEKIDAKVKEDLREYINETPFEVIRESAEHRKRVDGMTFRTSSDRVCYWCLSEECLHARRYHTTPKNAGLDREKLERQTIHTCPMYNRKIEQALKRT